MNEVPVSRTCLYCERTPAATPYGLCPECNQIKAIRRVYRVGRGKTPEWEAHLLRLTERAKHRLPLFPDGYESPRRPALKWRKFWWRTFVPRLWHAALPPRELEE
jgi:hypothetical protein